MLSALFSVRTWFADGKVKTAQFGATWSYNYEGQVTAIQYPIHAEGIYYNDNRQVASDWLSAGGCG